MRRFSFAALSLALFACKSEQPEARSYFDRTIAPILEHSCSRQTTGCHVEDAHGRAVGNLATTSYAAIARRRDLLVTYGPYPQAALLAKVIGPQRITVEGPTATTPIDTDIRHAAANGIDVTSDAYATLARWLENGATEWNVGTPPSRPVPSGACRSSIPRDVAFDASVTPPAFDLFVEKVQPILAASCAAGSCHGAGAADLALTCGDDDAQRKWNATIAAQYLSDPPESSELLRRALAPSAGGTWHGGGAIFSSTSDDGYQALLAWAKARGPATIGKDEEGLRFFAERVQPTLVRKGCMFQGCHSPLMFHEYPLRGGAGGRFSVAATRRNYESSKKMLALEAPDPAASRLIAKNLYPFDRDLDPAGLGVRHRGGPLFEDVPGVDRATVDACSGFDAEHDDLSKIPAYCVLIAWQAKERAHAISVGAPAGGVDASPLRAIAYVSRPPDRDVPQDFDTYRPGAALHLVDATLSGGDVVLGTDRVVDCGLDPATTDLRRPAVSWDGSRIAFAARTSATTPFAIYVMNADGTACAKSDAISAHAASAQGILLHDFDPAWAPDGRLVFASTRGAMGQSDVAYSGPTRTPDGLRPNANLYVLEGGSIRQLTFLNGQELAPAFKRNGQLIFSVEKRAPGFYQLAARRQNLDGTDYHPLYAQRKSIGFEQLVDVGQLANGNVVGVFSDRGALARGGALGVVNRSLGPDQIDRDPTDRFYLKSLTLLGGSGKKRDHAGVYRGPAPLPAPSVVASFAEGADAFDFDGVYRLVQVDVRNGARRELLAASGRALVDATAVFARAGRDVFSPSITDFHVEPGARDAEVRNLDFPMIASLFFDNRRVGRTVDERLRAVGVLESLPVPPEITRFDLADARFVANDEYGPLWVSRRSLGVAPLLDDGSIAYRLPGGMPFVLELRDGGPIAGAPLATQTEEGQVYPGERAKASFRRSLFDANCGGCHGAISNREVDVHLLPDVVTEASRVLAIEAPAFDLATSAAARGPAHGP